MKTPCHRRTFLRRAGATLAGAAGLTTTSSLAEPAGTRAIKLGALPSTLPFILDETFGPIDAKGDDPDRWLLLARFELTRHVDADGEDARVEDLVSESFAGSAEVHTQVHPMASAEDDTPERWRELSAEGSETAPWAYQLRDRDSRPRIYVYDPQPLAAAPPVGFSWTASLNREGRIEIDYDDRVPERRWQPPEGETSDRRAQGFQLGAALSPSPEPPEPEIAQSVNVHAAAFAFYSPHPGTPEVDLSYAGTTPNYSWPKGSQLSSDAGMATVSGGIGIGYLTTR